MWTLADKGRAVETTAHETALEVFSSVHADFACERTEAGQPETTKNETEEEVPPMTRSLLSSRIIDSNSWRRLEPFHRPASRVSINDYCASPAFKKFAGLASHDPYLPVPLDSPRDPMSNEKLGL